MLFRRPNMKRFLVVFLCLIALFGVQLTGAISTEAGAGSSPLPATGNASPTNRTYKYYNNVKPQDVTPLAPTVTACIAGTLSAGSTTFNRSSSTATGSGLGTCPSGITVPYNIYQFTLSGCTTSPAQV